MSETAEEAYERFLEEAQREPIKYLKHDTSAHDDVALARMVAERGLAYLGLYWILAEHLGDRKDHDYPVADELGWRFLAHDLGCMCDVTIDDAKQFVATLYQYGLIDREYYDELHKVSIKRIRMDAIDYAEGVARKKLGAWKTNHKQLFKDG